PLGSVSAPTVPIATCVSKNVLLAALVLGGCASLPYQSMSPEQINALAKIKDASIGCVSGVYACAKVHDGRRERRPGLAGGDDREGRLLSRVRVESAAVARPRRARRPPA